jgi:hypothetical protein
VLDFRPDNHIRRNQAAPVKRRRAGIRPNGVAARPADKMTKYEVHSLGARDMPARATQGRRRGDVNHFRKRRRAVGIEGHGYSPPFRRGGNHSRASYL